MQIKLPSFQFYIGDWQKDPNLRRASKSEKGVLIDMLCLMYECEDRGVLSTGGVPWSDNDVAAAIGGDISENLTCLTELLRKGIVSRNQSGAVFSRRMVRDEHKRKLCSEAGVKGGGNPTFKGHHKGDDKGHSKGDPKQNANPSSSSSSSSSSSNKYKLRLNALFGRKDTTVWSNKEESIFRYLSPRTEFESELIEIERYYTSGTKYLRQDLQTLLNNWSGELDRARKSTRSIQVSKMPSSQELRATP